MFIATGAEYSNASGKVWSVYLNEAEKQDTALAENWKGDTEGILIFVSFPVIDSSHYVPLS